MNLPEFEEYLDLLRTKNVMQAHVCLGEGISFHVVFGPEVAPESAPAGPPPSPGGWKGTQGLDLPFENEVP